jgi:DNA polymerase
MTKQATLFPDIGSEKPAATRATVIMPQSQMLPKVDYAAPAPAENWNGIVLVGEAPGADEVKQGKPFVGRSGQLLNKVLSEVGIEREHCLVCNTFRFQPPQNKVDTFFISKRAAQAAHVAIAEQYGKFGSSYCRADYAPELEHLRDILSQYKQRNLPMVIMALGRTPMWALTGENGLLQKAGNRLPCSLVVDVPVIPTFHPSFILRGNWSLMETWQSHFRTAKEIL